MDVFTKKKKSSDIFANFLEQKRIFTEEENTKYSPEITCFIFEDKFFAKDKTFYKVRYHCHYTIKCWEAAQSIYNLLYIKTSLFY